MKSTDYSENFRFYALLKTALISLLLLSFVLNFSATRAYSQSELDTFHTENSSSNRSDSTPKGIPENCKFDYWQLIPEELECDVFYLPDFDFRRLPGDPQINIRLKRFCENFEIRYGINSRIISYCKHPDRDGSGPNFQIEGKNYLADIYFEGCYNGKNTYGKVFTNNSWSEAPEHIKRIWRIKNRNDKLPDCKLHKKDS